MSVETRDIWDHIKVSAASLARPNVLAGVFTVLLIGAFAFFSLGRLLNELSSTRREAFLDIIHTGIDEAFVPPLKNLSFLESKVVTQSLMDEETLRSLGSIEELTNPIFILEYKGATPSRFKTVSQSKDSTVLSEAGAERILSLMKDKKILFVTSNVIGEKFSYVVRKVQTGTVNFPDASSWEIRAIALPFDIMKLSAPVLEEIAGKGAKITIGSGEEDFIPILTFGTEYHSLLHQTHTETFDLSIFDAMLRVTVITPTRFGGGSLERNAQTLVGIGTLMILSAFLLGCYSLITSIEKAVTKEQETEAKLRMKSEQLKTLLATAPMGIFISTVDGSSFVGNEVFRSLFGISVGATKSEQWLEAVHPNERTEVRDAFITACKTGERFDREFRVVLNGETAWRHMRTSPVGGTGARKITYCIGTVQDFTPQSDMITREEKSSSRPSPEQVSEGRVDEALAAIADSVAACHQELKELRSHDTNKTSAKKEPKNVEKKPLAIRTRTTSIFEGKNEESPSAYPHAILSKVLTLLQYKAEANGVVLGMEIDSSAPKELDTPPWLLTQSLIEMVDSAITSSSTGSVKVIYGVKAGAPFFSVVERPRPGGKMRASDKAFSGLNSLALDSLSSSGKTPTKVSRKSLSGKGFVTSVALAHRSNENSVLIVEERADVREHFEQMVKSLGLRPVAVKDTTNAWTRLCSETFQFVIVDTSLGELPESLRSSEGGKTVPIIGIRSDNTSPNAEFDHTVEEDCTSDELRAALEEIASSWE